MKFWFKCCSRKHSTKTYKNRSKISNSSAKNTTNRIYRGKDLCMCKNIKQFRCSAAWLDPDATKRIKHEVVPNTKQSCSDLEICPLKIENTLTMSVMYFLAATTNVFYCSHYCFTVEKRLSLVKFRDHLRKYCSAALLLTQIRFF